MLRFRVLRVLLRSKRLYQIPPDSFLCMAPTSLLCRKLVHKVSRRRQKSRNLNRQLRSIMDTEKYKASSRKRVPRYPENNKKATINFSCIPHNHKRSTLSSPPSRRKTCLSHPCRLASRTLSCSLDPRYGGTIRRFFEDGCFFS